MHQYSHHFLLAFDGNGNDRGIFSRRLADDEFADRCLTFQDCRKVRPILEVLVGQPLFESEIGAIRPGKPEIGWQKPSFNSVQQRPNLVPVSRLGLFGGCRDRQGIGHIRDLAFGQHRQRRQGHLHVNRSFGSRLCLRRLGNERQHRQAGNDDAIQRSFHRIPFVQAP